MVAGRENLEAITSGENAPEELDNVSEDNDDDPVEDEVSGDDDEAEADAEEPEESEDEDDDDEDEEDPEDPQDTLREKCGEISRCVALKSEFDTCEGRVNSRTKTEENCAQELLDFVGCVDKCVSKSLFSHLK
ncbi:cytochrome b-c1 complex subunit 6, mitochondrial-like [Dendronephthya gigantea]|uniref:cytochrome b-c1 complex subunit 6, mitochondrial-like n=1 Tax=Dendronephthya gigantea TaxID=151771 RepID=UPI00106C8C0E|nr:cytochrome b-c1 complex subunit 6, mitochondrial-like [Dendronephthya gigantea]